MTDLRYNCLIAVAVLSVAVMLSSQFCIGYASSYTAETASTGNSIEFSYFTVSVYSYNSYTSSTVPPIDCTSLDIDSNFTPINMIQDSSANISYTTEGGLNKITGERKLTSDNLFFILKNSGFSDVTFKVKPRAVIDSTAASAYGSNCVTVSIIGAGSPDGDGYYTISPLFAYKLSAVATFSYSSASTPPNISTNIYLDGIVTDSATGIYTESKNLTMVQTGSETYQEVVEENGGSTITNGSGHDYNLTPGPTMSGGNESIVISGNNDGGIAEGTNGKVDVTLSIPHDKKFVVAFTYQDDDNKSQQFKLSIIVVHANGTIAGYIANKQTVSLSLSNTERTVYYDADGSMNTVINSYTKWFEVGNDYNPTDKITIKIEDIGNASHKIKMNTKLYIVFQS